MFKNFKNKKGFSLVEFMTIVVIFGIISSVSTFSYNQYRYNIERTNLAQDIALTVRQAQLYGISASNRGVGTEDFDSSDLTSGQIQDIALDTSIRGVSIELDGGITIFEDVDRNFIYNSGTDRVIDLRTIQSSKNSFSYFVLCENSSSCITVNSGSPRVDIVFKRPDPDAIIRGPSGTLTKAIFVIAQNGTSTPNKYIEVNSSGSINVGTDHS